MSDKEDQIDYPAGIGLNDLVSNEKNQERRTWKFCNSRLPQSEVVYFTQILIILFLIDVSLIKLVFFQLDCEESTFWFSLLSCTVGYAVVYSWLFVGRHAVVKLSSYFKCYSETSFIEVL